MAMSS